MAAVIATHAPIVVVARWRVREGFVGEVLGLVSELRGQSLAEPGCLGYDVYRSLDSAGEILLVERYRDAAAIDAHRASAHFQALVLGRIVPLLAERQVELLDTRPAA